MSSILTGILNEGISAQDLADVLYNRLTMRYPDVVNRYGHEVVGDIISDVASFHEGAEELGTSDIGGMIRQIINKLENYNIDEAIDPAQQTVYAQVKGLVDQLDKRGKQNVSKALKKNLGVVTEEDEVDYDDKYQSMVKRVGQMAKEGPRKTVWDPVKKVYKTVPVGQPKTDASFQAYLAKRRAAKQGLGEGWKEETAEHDEFLQHARQQLQNASVMERIRLAQRLSKLEQKHFPEMFRAEDNGISSSIFGMLQNVIDSSPRPNQQFGNVVTPQGTGSSEPLRPEPISARPSGATTSFAEPDDELEQEQDFFTWYQSASAEQQAELQQDIASEENMSPEEAKEYIEYMVQNGKIEPEEWKQKYANTVDEGFDPIRPLDLKHWAQKVKMYYPDAQIISAKMPGGPSIAKSGGVQVGSFDPSKGTSKIIRPQGVSSISAGSTMEEGVAEGSGEAEAYKAHLIKTMPQMMNFLSKKVKGWTPSEEEMLSAIDTAYMVMKHTGDVKQAGKAMMDELNTLHRMSQGKQGVAEGSGEIKIPTEDGITMQDIRLMAGEGPLTKKTILQAIAVIRKQRRPQGVAEGLSKQFEIIYLDQNGERKRKIVSGTSKEAVARQFKKQYKLEIEQVKQLEQGVAEGSNDTIYPNAEVIKSKNGKPVGEIYQDGNSWGCFHYKADRGYEFIDSREDAIEALKDLHQETGRSRPDYTVKGVAEGSNDYFKRRKDEEDRIAGKKAPAKRTPRQTDYEKKRREQGVAEEKIKGADGKACWPGYRYNGTENGKDSCVKVKETKSNILKGLMG
jgi:hypothetical protein